MPWSGKRSICRCSTSTARMPPAVRSRCAGACSRPAPLPGERARMFSSSSSAGRASPGEAMSCRFTTSSSLALLAILQVGCSEVRGRKSSQAANELYKRGRYQEAVSAFESAEALVPNLPTLWLNKGYTCRQLIAPGGRDPESRRAADCALTAFQRLHELAPKDPRAEQLTVQTWFDTDDFATLEKNFLELWASTPNDYDVVHSLQEVYYKWGKWPQALEWSTRAAALRPNDAEAQYGVGTFIWQILASRGAGRDMAAYDPRPRPAPDDDAAAAARAKHRGKPGEPEMV